MGGRGASSPEGSSSKGLRKPEGMKQESFDRYISNGFKTQKEIDDIWKHTLYTREKFKKDKEKEKADYTTTTFDRWEKAQERKFNNWFGRK